MVRTASHEVALNEFLRNECGEDDHVLCIVEVIPLDDMPEFSILVMPCMRRCDESPFFATVREFTEFVEQVLKVSTVGHIH